MEGAVEGEMEGEHLVSLPVSYSLLSNQRSRDAHEFGQILSQDSDSVPQSRTLPLEARSSASEVKASSLTVNGIYHWPAYISLSSDTYFIFPLNTCPLDSNGTDPDLLKPAPLRYRLRYMYILPASADYDVLLSGY